MFELGNRVVGTKVFEGCNIVGRIGTVIGFGLYDILVEFDEKLPNGCGHDGDGRGKDKHCWYCAEGCLDLVEQEYAVTETSETTLKYEDLFF